MKNRFLLLFCLLASSHLCFTQLNILSQKNIGGSGNDGLSIYKSPVDQGYYGIGTSSSNISFDKSENSRGGNDLWIVKFDANFNIQWDKTIGGDQDDNLVSAIVTDSIIFCLLSTTSGVSGDKISPAYGSSDAWLVKMDLNGNLMDETTYGGTSSDSPSQVCSFADKIVVIASSRSPISGTKTLPSKGLSDYWVLSINPSDLAILNEQVIGSSSEDISKDAVVFNNEIYIAGLSPTGTSADKTDTGFGSSTNCWVVKLDDQLEIVANKCFGGINGEDLSARIRQFNNEIYLSISSYSNGDGNKSEANFGSIDAFIKLDTWIVKANSNLDIIWDKSFGGTHDDVASNLFFTNQNRIIVHSTSKSGENTGNKTVENYGLSDSWMIILDTMGNTVGQYNLGGSASEGGTIVFQSGDSLFFNSTSSSPVSGNKTVGSNGGTDAWFVILDASSLGIHEFSEANKVVLYPNPSNGTFTLSFSMPSAANLLEIYTILGEKVSSKELELGTQSVELNFDLSAGVYIYSIGENQGKFVISE